LAAKVHGPKSSSPRPGVAWAAAATAFQRIDVTAQFLLNLTQAEVDNLNAKYDYQSQYAALQYATGLLR
jgi:hypothetical protein